VQPNQTQPKQNPVYPNPTESTGNPQASQSAVVSDVSISETPRPATLKILAFLLFALGLLYLGVTLSSLGQLDRNASGLASLIAPGSENKALSAMMVLAPGILVAVMCTALGLFFLKSQNANTISLILILLLILLVLGGMGLLAQGPVLYAITGAPAFIGSLLLVVVPGLFLLKVKKDVSAWR
jgi:hypothetical protein